MHGHLFVKERRPDQCAGMAVRLSSLIFIRRCHRFTQITFEIVDEAFIFEAWGAEIDEYLKEGEVAAATYFPRRTFAAARRGGLACKFDQRASTGFGKLDCAGAAGGAQQPSLGGRRERRGWNWIGAAGDEKDTWAGEPAQVSFLCLPCGAG